MTASAAAPVLRMAGQVSDPRRHNKLHPLPQMIVMALIAVLCGCDGWEDVAEYCQTREAWFKTFLSLPRGVPSHDTMGRVFARLDPDQLESMLAEWMQALHVGSCGRLIAIDGKSLRRSFEHGWQTHAMTHIVSAFAAENQLVLAQLGVNDKENEIVAIPKLLELIDLKGATVTIDAIGCQREIAKQITEAKGHFVLQLKDNQPTLHDKDNQPTLHDKVKALLDEAILEQLVGWRGSMFEDVDAGHGRIETGQVWLTTEVKHLGKDLLELWPGIKAIAAVERTRELGSKRAKAKGKRAKASGKAVEASGKAVEASGKAVEASGKAVEMDEQPAEPSVQRSYFILSDNTCTAERVGQIIRGHWAIENGLHYVLDVSFNEDQSRVRKGNGAENLSRLRRLSANLLRRNPSKRSIKGQRKNCCWSDEYLFETLFRGLETAQTT